MATITETGTIDLKAQKEAHDEASQVATNYITPNGTSEAAFHPEASSTNQVKVDGTGVDIIKGNASVAKYGDVARIGKSSESRVEIDYHSLKLIDKDGNTYLHISDLRDANGSATMLETFIVDDNTEITSNSTRFELSYPIKSPIADNIVSVKVDQVTLYTDEYGIYNEEYGINSYQYLSIYRKLNFLQEVQIEYMTGSAVRAFSFGQRNQNSLVGAESFVEGYNNTASGRISHAEGSETLAGGINSHAEGLGTEANGHISHAEGSGTEANGTSSHAEGSDTLADAANAHAEGRFTEANGTYSHAEGFHTQANGLRSHSEGSYTTAIGDASHSQNLGTIAHGEAQTAIGKYNVNNTDDDLAFIVGNGTADNARSNAFTVDWDGNTFTSGKLQLRNPLINRDNPGGSDVWDTTHCIEICDADGERTALIRGLQRSDGRTGVSILACNEKTDGTEVTNDFNVYVARDGTKSYGLGDPAALRSAIAAFSTSGGIITGPVYAKNTVIDRKVNPSSAQYSTDVGGGSSFQLVDKNGAVLGYIRASKQTDGRTGLDFRVWNSDTAGSNVVHGAFQIFIDRSGTVTYSINDQANFRNAIGASSGIFPRSVGGTGMSARTTGTVTRTNVSTAGAINAYSNGVVCTVSAKGLQLKTALASGSTVILATLPAGYRPPMDVYSPVYASVQSRNCAGFIRIESDGDVHFANVSGASWATTSNIAFTVTWAL